MTRNEAFEHCLEHAIKPAVTKGVWASYKFRFKDGVLKEKTITELLRQYGYTCVQAEAWDIPGSVQPGNPIEAEVEPEDTYFTVASFDRNKIRFSVRTYKADNAKEAIQKNKGGVDVTDDMQKLVDFVNNTIEEYNRY